MALTKSAFKIGVSLAPVVGGVLSATVDVMAELVDSLPEGAVAVVRHLADPMDLPVALEVLSLARSVEVHLSEGQAKQLSEVIQPFESLESLQDRVGWAVKVLDLPAEAEGGEIVHAVGEATGNCDASEAVSDGGSDPLEDFENATMNATIEHDVDHADVLLNRRAWRPAVSPPRRRHRGPAGRLAGDGDNSTPRSPGAPASTAISAAATRFASSRSTRVELGTAGPASPRAAPLPLAPQATAVADTHRTLETDSRPSDTVLFAGACNWTVAQLSDRLVAYVARVYEAPMREELETGGQGGGIALRDGRDFVAEYRRARDGRLFAG